MTTLRSSLVTMAVCTAVLLALGASAARASTSARDDVHRDPALAARPFATIAILPVASVNENEDAERFVENTWTEFGGDGGIRWVLPDDVRAAVARGEARVNLDAVHARIWKSGDVDSEAAGELARALGVDAVLCVRVDRWELVDGGRAMVGMTATLAGADGAPLWSIHGGAGCGTPRTSGRGHFTSDLDRIWPSRLEPGDHGTEKLGCALHTLLARWQGELPTTPTLALHGIAPAPEATGLD